MSRMRKSALGVFLPGILCTSIAWLVAGASSPCLAEGYELPVDALASMRAGAPVSMLIDAPASVPAGIPREASPGPPIGAPPEAPARITIDIRAGIAVDIPNAEITTPLILPSPSRASFESGSGPALHFYPPEVDARRALQVITTCAVLSGMDAELYGMMNAGMASREAGLPVVHQIAQGAGYLGDGSVTLGICLALSARDPETARVGAKAVIYSGLLAGIIKYSLGRARPGMGLGPGHYSGPLALSPGFDSMPSGHSAAAFALATVLARRYPGYRNWFWGLAGLTAISRVWQGAHWPSDVFMGSAIGILAADTAMRGDAAWAMRENAARAMREDAARAMRDDAAFGSSVEGQALTSSLPCGSMNLTE